jgi:hypothetical protein
MKGNPMRVKELFAFMHERHQIFMNRTVLKKPAPWTKDPILQKYRFCNVYRELDAVTMWIAKNWRKPNQDDPNLWFAMVIARLLNNPGSLGFLGYPETWNAPKFLHKLATYKRSGHTVFNGAYIVSTNGVAMDKLDYLAQRVLTPLWKKRIEIAPRLTDTCRTFHRRLMEYDGLGSFLAAQVVADVKWVMPLRKSKDFWTFAAPGPGSKRGMNRVTSIGQTHIGHLCLFGTWEDALVALHQEINPLITKYKMPRLSAQDLQNCLCEFDKYERARLGEGRPKQRFDGGK